LGFEARRLELPKNLLPCEPVHIPVDAQELKISIRGWDL